MSTRKLTFLSRGKLWILWKRLSTLKKEPNLGIKKLSCIIIWKRNGPRHEAMSR